MSQLAEITKPFPRQFVHANPSGGGQYVKHSTVVQRLLQVVGPYSFQVFEVLRGYVPAIAPDPNGKSNRAKNGAPALDNAIIGALCRLTVIIDGREVIVEEVGECEQPQNWPHDGARLKDATSDAIKRCAMRLGMGLHLWAQDEYYVHDRLKEAGDPSGANHTDSSTVPSSTQPEVAPETLEGVA